MSLFLSTVGGITGVGVTGHDFPCPGQLQAWGLALLIAGKAGLGRRQEDDISELLGLDMYIAEEICICGP